MPNEVPFELIEQQMPKSLAQFHLSGFKNHRDPPKKKSFLNNSRLKHSSSTSIFGPLGFRFSNVVHGDEF